MPVIPSPYAIYSFETSGYEIIKDAYQKLRNIDPDENLTASDLALGVRTLNRMVDSWNTEGLMVAALNTSTQTLVGGTQVYTIGPGATFDTVAPLRLNEHDVVLTINGVDRELRPLTAQQYAAITLKSTPGSALRILV